MMFFESEVPVSRARQFDQFGNLVLQLLRCAKDVRIVLHEAARPHQAVQGARRLVAMHGTELGHAQRQVPVALEPLVEQLDVSRAVHRLDCVLAVLGLGGEDHLAELVPVPGSLP